MRRIVLALCLVLVGSSAFAQDVPPPVAADDELMSAPETPAPVEPKPAVVPPDPEKDPGAVVSALANAVRGGKWTSALGVLVLVLVWAARKWGAKRVPFFATSKGGVVLSALCASLLVVGGSMMTGWTWSCLLAAAEAAAVASGLWSLGKNAKA
jgi:hypothetical protein